MRISFEQAAQSYGKIVGSLEDLVQSYWKTENTNHTGTDPDADNAYVLGMFPYPSGNAHMGHALVYSITDSISRLRRFKGDNVLHPIGWDAFGLPAENAAFKNKIHPASWTESNIRDMRDEQIGRMGFSFDYDRELNTSSPDFYKWSQWLFIKLYEEGLVYRSYEWVNWDPVDKTVLANEQVIDGKGWRSGASIERKKMEQWYIRITDYAERLYQGLNELPHWSDAAKAAQRYWIGRSEGADIAFKLKQENDCVVTVFTTRPETIYGATAVLLAPETEDFDHLMSKETLHKVKAYRRQSMKKSDVERAVGTENEAVNTGLEVTHPLTGHTLPVYMADYVLNSHGSCGFMCVPAHDAKDYAFAQKHNLTILPVVQSDQDAEIPYTLQTGMLINSDEFSGLSCQKASKEIVAYLEEQNIGSKTVRYRLKDWALGRQRFWGAPIPMIKSAEGFWDSVSLDELPVSLPDDIDFDANKRGSPLAASKSFINYTDKSGKSWQRETDTMDTFMCSAWYIWRFLDPKNNEQAWSFEDAKKWMPVDTYVGGLEHSNQHLIYARFISYFLYDMGLTPTEEPIRKFLNNGMVQMDGVKMSKSKGNVVRPDHMVDKYGADALHMYILSTGPYDRNFDWDESGLRHKQQFLSRIYNLYKNSEGLKGVITLEEDDVRSEYSRKLLSKLSQTARSVEHEILENATFHVAIAKTHELANEIFSNRNEMQTSEEQKVYSYVLQNFLKILGLTAPHLSEYLWQSTFEMEQSLFIQPWVSVDEALLPKKAFETSVPVMINGKKRAEFSVMEGESDQVIIDRLMAKKDDLNLTKAFDGASLGRAILVREDKGQPLSRLRLINLQLIKDK